MCRSGCAGLAHRGCVPGQHRLAAGLAVQGETGALLPDLPGHLQTAEGLEAAGAHPPHHVQWLRAELPVGGVHQGRPPDTVVNVVDRL